MGYSMFKATGAIEDTKRAAITKIKNRIDSRLNDYLCEMEPGYDDSITGFNEAWDIVHKTFEEALNEDEK
jgi:hypothetical protein